MTRIVTIPANDLRRARRDPRFRAAAAGRIPRDPQWRTRGACLGHDPDLFFPHAAEDPTPALEICRDCPVTGSCLAAALDAGDCDGVWGGTTPEDRRPMRQAWVGGGV